MKKLTPVIKKVLSYVMVAILGIIIYSFLFTGDGTTPQQDSKTDMQEGEKKEQKKTLWTCSMHPEVQLPEPGKCPKCGMDLIPMDDEGGDQTSRKLEMSPVAKKLAEVQTTKAVRKYVSVRPRLYGELHYDETQVKTITAWVSGRLERLFVDFTGTRVNRGDHMVKMYSPEIRTAETELIQARKAYKNAPEGSKSSALENLKSARKRLRLWGLTEKQIKQIKKQSRASDTVTIYSPMGGTVVKKMSNEGEYVKTGSSIYKIADLSRLWLLLEAYEQDLQWIRYGQKVTFETKAIPGETFRGRVSFIEPVLDRKTRTVGIRVNVKNKDRILKPGMYATAHVHSKIATTGVVMDKDLKNKWICPMHPGEIKDHSGQCSICGMDLVEPKQLGYRTVDDTEPPLVIPDSAPLLTGKRAVVYVEVPNTEKPTYEGRNVVLGPHAGDYYVVKSGLEEGESVVTNGNFKIDSDLQIRNKPSMMYPGSQNSEEEADERNRKNRHDHKSPGETGMMPEVPSAAKRKISNILTSYYTLQEKLANDDFPNAKSEIKHLRKLIESKPSGDIFKGEQRRKTWNEWTASVESSTKQAAEATDLKNLRMAFDQISKSLINGIKQFGAGPGDPAYRIHCPMAFDGKGADWLQPEKQIHNPYLGGKMPSCGTVKETIHRKK